MKAILLLVSLIAGCSAAPGMACFSTRSSGLDA